MLESFVFIILWRLFMISLIFFLIGTFGRIFHGILVDEKDPNKEKQVFVKTVKGKIFFLPYYIHNAFLLK